jgi:hypothetical protein
LGVKKGMHMKIMFKFIVFCLLLCCGNSVLPRFTDEDLVGAYQRADNQLLLLSQEGEQFYITDPALRIKNRVYKIIECDSKVQFVGWENGVTCFHDAGKNVIGLYRCSDETFFIKLQNFGLLIPTLEIDLSTFQPDYAQYNLFVGCYENSTLGRVHILHSHNPEKLYPEKLFLALDDDLGNCFELLPHISNETGTNKVNIFYAHGYKIIFNADQETMEVILKGMVYNFTRRKIQ